MKSLKEEKLYIKVVEEIKEEILNGNLKRGDKLPPERELAESLEVSRASVREAMRALEVGGLIDSKQGSGNFIRNDFSKSLIEPLSLVFLLNDADKRQIHEMRSSLAIQAALIANEKITDKEIAKLEDIVDRLANSHDEEINKDLDREFHKTIIDAADNVFINIFFSSISSLISNFIKDNRREILKTEEDKKILNNIHREIIDAFKEKNRTKLYDSVKRHADIVYKTVVEEKKKL